MRYEVGTSELSHAMNAHTRAHKQRLFLVTASSVVGEKIQLGSRRNVTSDTKLPLSSSTECRLAPINTIRIAAHTTVISDTRLLYDLRPWPCPMKDQPPSL